MESMTSPTQIRILCVDDHPVLREGVAAMIDTQSDMLLVGEASGGEEAVAKFRALLPDVTLMDLQMPGMDGFAAIQAIRAELPTAKIVVFTTFEGDAQAARALRSGAAGYLLKSTLRRDLLNTIRSVYAGRRHVPAEIAQEIALHSAEKQLTERELRILKLVSDGYSNKAIARQLGLAEDTVKAHLKRVFSKLGVDDRTHAVTTAIRRGILG
jgi:DNA-binding NarL/FixJ family response regulator